MLKRFCLPIVTVLLISVCSCRQGEHGSSQSSGANNSEERGVELKTDRFEMDLFAVPFDSVAERIPGLQKKYKAFFDIFTNRIINIGNSKRPDFAKNLKSFITDRYMFLTYQKVKEVYPNINEPLNELNEAFEIYHQVFPKKRIPHFYTLISGYNQSVVTDDTILGISLDKYLGENCEYYENLQIPMYQRRLMSKDYFATDAMRGWCYSEFLFNDSGENVLTNILYEGKMVYLMKQLFPEKHDSIIMGYTNKQLEWCKANIEPMWTFLVERKLIFSTDYMTINKLVNPAPFTALFDNESPGRAVIWLGYRIVDAYMKNNDVTLTSLMADQNYQGILEKSKFSPK